VNVSSSGEYRIVEPGPGTAAYRTASGLGMGPGISGPDMGLGMSRFGMGPGMPGLDVGLDMSGLDMGLGGVNAGSSGRGGAGTRAGPGCPNGRPDTGGRKFGSSSVPSSSVRSSSSARSSSSPIGLSAYGAAPAGTWIGTTTSWVSSISSGSLPGRNGGGKWPTIGEEPVG
jgi:hypothetical protein